MTAQFKNERGKRYGRLSVLDRYEKPTTNRVYWLCQCDCGECKPVLGDHLRSNAIVSCGCVGQLGGKLRRNRKPVPPKTRARAVRPQESTAAGEIIRRGDNPFIAPHAYRTPRRIDMGPIVAAALAAVEARRAA